MEFPDDRKYAESHEWAKADGNRVTMGISDYAQDALGDVVFVELPEVGASVTAAEPCAEVESTKSVTDVYAPVSGTVVQINEALEDNPEIVNASPYGDGWFAVIEATDLTELDNLLDAAGYEASTA